MIITNFPTKFIGLNTMDAVINGKDLLKLEIDKKNPHKGTVNGEAYSLDVSKTGSGTFHILKNHKTYSVEVLEASYPDKKFVLLVNGTRYEVALQNDFDNLLKSMGIGVADTKLAKEVRAPMPGLVLDILVQEGSVVVKGETIVILEAMKMENVLKSPVDGVIKAISINKGVAVEKNQVLVSFV